MWLFMLFALVIYEVIVETKKENARQARVDRVMKQLRPDEIKYGFDGDKWDRDFYAQNPWMLKYRNSSNANKDNESK